MDQQHGTWGSRIRTFKTDSALVTVLWLGPHKRCSYHSHKTAYNQFFVISGRLGVLTDTGPGGMQETILTEKQYFTVPPNVKHEFRTYDVPTIIEEVAFVKYDDNDIDRETPGGDFFEGKA